MACVFQGQHRVHLIYYLVSAVFEWCMAVCVFNIISHVHVCAVINTADRQMTTKKKRTICNFSLGVLNVILVLRHERKVTNFLGLFFKISQYITNIQLRLNL